MTISFWGKYTGNNMTKDKTYKGLNSALEALKSLNTEEQQKLLEQLLLKDPELVKQLKSNLFEFADISKMAKADFKLIWFELPRNLWHLSLRGATDELMLFIRSCHSERAFNQLLDELKEVGPQPKSKVLAAQRQIISEIQSLAQQGRVHVPKALK